MERRIFSQKSGHVGPVLSLAIGNALVEWEESEAQMAAQENITHQFMKIRPNITLQAIKVYLNRLLRP